MSQAAFPIGELEVAPVTRVLRALADETRVRIVALLAHGELCVCHLENALGLPQPNVSRHLGILRAAGVVLTRRDGTWVYYRLAPQEARAATEVLEALVRAFGAERSIRADHAKLRKSCGPGACK